MLIHGEAWIISLNVVLQALARVGSPFSWRHGNYACYTDWYWDPVSQYWTIDKCDVIDPKSCWDKSRYCWYWESQPSGPPKKKFRYESISYISETNCPETGGINNDLHCHPVCD